MIKSFKSSEVNIWFTSDIHGYHKNITRGTSEWEEGRGARDFDSVEEMTYTMTDGINKYVGEDDILFFLGDWTFGGIDKIWILRQAIDCKNIYFIAGNHDMHILNNKVLPNCQWDGFNNGGFVRTKIVNSGSHQRTIDVTNQVSAQSLFNFCGTSDLIKIDKTYVYMSHFPSEGVRYDNRSYHLFGHVHGTYKPSNTRLDVGIDHAYKLFGEYRPFSWDDIKEIKNKR